MQNSGKIPLCNLVYHWIFHAWIFHPWVFHAVMGDWRKQWLPLPARELGLNFIQGRISDGIQVLEHRNPVCVFVPAGSLLRGRNRIRRWRQWQWRRRLRPRRDRKSTRLNSSHLVISYAVFCLKKKKTKTTMNTTASKSDACI